MLSSIKSSLSFYLANAKLIDYLAYGWIILAFIFFFFLAIFILIRYSWQFGILLILLDLFGIFAGLYYTREFLNNHLRSSEIMDLQLKQLEYSDTLAMKFKLKNNSKKPFAVCKVDFAFYKSSNTKIKDFISSLKPFKKKSLSINEQILPNTSIDMDIMVKNFAFTDYSISKKVECF